MRCFVAMCVFREGASEVGPDMPAAQKRREELWKLSPAGPFFGLTMAHANHGLTAVLAVQLPWKTLHYSGLQGRYRAQQGGHVTFVPNGGRAAAASAASFMPVRHHPSTPSWSQ